MSKYFYLLSFLTFFTLSSLDSAEITPALNTLSSTLNTLVKALDPKITPPTPIKSPTSSNQPVQGDSAPVGSSSIKDVSIMLRSGIELGILSGPRSSIEAAAQQLKNFIKEHPEKVFIFVDGSLEQSDNSSKVKGKITNIGINGKSSEEYIREEIKGANQLTLAPQLLTTSYTFIFKPTDFPHTQAYQLYSFPLSAIANIFAW